jgi:spermidine/putrescine transport system permease protein
MTHPIHNPQFTIHNSPVLPRLYIALALLFLYAPILVMMLMAFNRSQLNELPFHFDLVWFERLAQNRRLISATLNSIILAALTALTATALGTLAALALARYSFRGRGLLQALLIPPITIPWLILAVAMLIMFFWLGVPRSLLTLYLGHVTVQLPYTILVIGARLTNTDPALEQAAASLGARPGRVFWRITFPLALPGIFV